MSDRKKHWETVYQTKNPEQVSWTQAVPQTSLDLIHACVLPKDAAVIDIGGGDSLLVDHLLNEGYTHISVLDISSAALERAQKRLGDRASLVTWIESDIRDFQPNDMYDIWHDRAAFHFLTQATEIDKYAALCRQHINHYLILGTFSDKGPLKCSGLEVSRYNKDQLSRVFSPDFDCVHSHTELHHTPFETTQDFLFSSFKRAH